MSRKVEIRPEEAKRATRPECPVTRTQFQKEAKPLEVVINGQSFTAMPRVFKTKSFGYHLNPKIMVKVGETLLECQVGLNITGIHSKQAED